MFDIKFSRNPSYLCAYFENQHQRLIATIKAGRNLAHFIVVDDDYDKTFVRNKPRLIRVGRLPEKTGFEGLGFKIRYDEEKDGHYVDQVFDEGPAKDAGLKVGDRIIQLNGHTTEGIEFEDIYDQLSGFTASQCIMLVTDQGPVLIQPWLHLTYSTESTRPVRSLN